VIDDVLEHHHPSGAGDHLLDRGQHGPVHGGQGAAMEVEAREALDLVLLADIDGYAVRLGCADHVAEVGEPPLRHEEGTRPVTGGQGPTDDLLGLGDVEAALGLEPTTQGDIGEADIVGEPLVAGISDVLDHGPPP
jgi:hypothetical protein